jgi:hypothetical protein
MEQDIKILDICEDILCVIVRNLDGKNRKKIKTVCKKFKELAENPKSLGYVTISTYDTFISNLQRQDSNKYDKIEVNLLKNLQENSRKRDKFFRRKNTKK